MTSTTTRAENPITESKFAALKAKLRELFELDKSDLDFGIYRIMAAKNQEVTDFLDRQLKDVVRETLSEHGSAAAEQAQAELDEAIEQAHQLGVDPDSVEKVQQLRAKVEAGGSTSAAELEADIYNHLLTFFSRYYDEGDFISQRRYKGDTYAIPYAGEEVKLHWANKDQYYVKSGEWHKDYRFRVPGHSDKAVRFKLVEATQEANNNKEADDAKRRYVLDSDNPVQVDGNELILRFQFRVPTDEEKQAVKDSEVTRIFGGKYDQASSRTQGDEREQFCADAERRAVEAMANEWAQLVTSPGSAATDSRPNRTLLGRHLDEFTARNTFDYFIHKDLGGFLRRELDFYIKNEVLRLDDLEALADDHLARVQGKVKAIRRVADRIIDFLASVEEFQKKLWLKKKFVLETNWLVTIDRIPKSLRDTVAANAEQWGEWGKLGFKPEDTENGGLFHGAQWGSREYLDANDKLVVDTRFFDCDFKAELLASEEVLGGSHSLEEAMTGVLANSENYQATSLLTSGYAGRAHTIYLDPPYNTDASAINYKNGYKSSSWSSLMYDRLAVGQHLLANGGVLAIAIDDEQQPELHFILSEVFDGNLLGTICVRSNPSGRPLQTGYSVSHEYVVFAGNDTRSSIRRLPPTDDQAARFNQQDEQGSFEWRNLRREGSNSDRSARRHLYYPIYVSGTSIRIPRMRWSEESEDWIVEEECRKDEHAVWPTNDEGDEKTWRWEWKTVAESTDALAVRKDRSGRDYIYYKRRPHNDGVVAVSSWFDAKYSATEHGTALLKSLFGKNPFSYPKSIYAVIDSVYVAGASEPSSMVADYFAGSGTTGHAVISLNRHDNGCRRFVLVEMGAYFESVLKPRIVKNLYCSEWEDGRPVDHNDGLSALVKYFSVESHEDSLNNLPTPDNALLDSVDRSAKDVLITYSLDLELGPHLLDLDIFRDPWGHTINAQPAGADEIREHRVDLVETFNYLIGLKVRAYGPIGRYNADFERAEHEENLGRLKVSGRLRRDPEGPYVFQRVEGELNDGADTRVLVIWRKLTDEPEKDAAVLDAWMARHRESTRERTEHRDYHVIYVNGPVTLPQPTQEIRTVFPIEQTFKDCMFADTAEGGSV